MIWTVLVEGVPWTSCTKLFWNLTRSFWQDFRVFPFGCLIVDCYSHCGTLWLFCVLLCVALCPFKLCNHFDGEERAGCFALFVLLVSHDCCVSLPQDTTGLSAVCDCGISWLYSLTIFMQHIILLRAHFSQNVKYWYEIHDVLVPIFLALWGIGTNFANNLRSVKFAFRQS